MDKLFNTLMKKCRTHSLISRNLLYTASMLGGVSFTHAADYAFISYDAGSAVEVDFDQNLVDIFENTESVFDFFVLSGGAYVNPPDGSNIQFANLSSSDILNFPTGWVNFDGGITTSPFWLGVRVDGEDYFNSQLSIPHSLSQITFNLENGNLTLSSSSSLSGNGTIIFLNGGSTARTVHSQTNLNSFDGTFNIGNNTTFELQNTGTQTLNATLTGLGALTKIGSGSLNVASSAGSFSGPVTLSAGLTTMQSNGSLGTGALTLSGTSQLDLAGQPLYNTSMILTGGSLLNNTGSFTYNAPVSVQTSSTIGGVGDINLSNLTIASATTLTKSGTGTLTLSGILNTVSGPINIAEGTLVFNHGTDQTLSYSLLGSGSFHKTGGTTLTLAASSGNYHGAATIYGGFATVSADNALGVGTLNIESGATVNLTGSVLGNTTVNLSGTMRALSGANSYTAGYVNVLSNATVQTESGTSLTLAHLNHQGSTLTKNGDGTLTLSGALSTVTAPIVISAGTLAVDNSGDEELTSALSGAGSFYKTGAGTLTLSGSLNTYAGPSTIHNGMVTVGSSEALGTGMLTIHQAATVNLIGHALGNTSMTLQGGTISSASGTNTYGDTITVSADSYISALSTLTLTGMVTGAGVKLTKAVSGALVLSPTSTFDTNLSVFNGVVRLQGALGQNFEEAAISSGSSLEIYGSGLDSRKNVAVAISGAGDLYLHNGWLDLRGSDVTVANVHIMAANSGLETMNARVMIDESFNPNASGTIVLDGILEAYIAQDDNPSHYILENTITGSGLLKKYGDGTLNLTGDLSGFTGAIQVFEGVLTTNETRSSDVELYTGATLISNFENVSGSSASLSGNLLGGKLVNDGVLHLGNNSTETQILSFTEFLNRGEGIYVNYYSYGHVRVNELTEPVTFLSGNSNNSHWGSFFVYNGTLAFNGHFLESICDENPHNEAYAYSHAEISLDPGSVFEGTLHAYNGGIIRLQGSNLDEDTLVNTVSISSDGVVDIVIDKINNSPSQTSIVINDLTLYENATMALHPDVTADSSDAPLLKIEDSLYLSQLYGDNSLFYQTYFSNQRPVTINVVPIGDMGSNETITVNLLQLEGSSDTEINREQILSALKTSLLYEVQEALFAENVLQCTLRYRNPSELLASDSLLQGLPLFYSTLIKSIISQHDNNNVFTQDLYHQVINSLSSGSLLEYLRSVSPVGSLPSLMHESYNKYQANSIMQMHKQTMLVSKIADKSGKNRPGGSSLLDNIFQHQMKENQRVLKHAPENPAPRLESFRYVNLDGLSFDSQVQYQHQKEPNRSQDDIGYSSHSWTASFGASYSKRNEYLIGTLLSTTKNKNTLNPNEIAKTGQQDDRLNTIGLVGYYAFDALPVTVSGIASYGQHNYDQVRTFSRIDTLTNQPLDVRASAQYQANETALQLEVGYTHTYADVLVVQPFVGALWSKVRHDAYQESAMNAATGESNNYGYIVPEHDYSSSLYSIGVELAGTRRINDIESLFFARIGASTQKRNGENSEFKYAIATDPNAELKMSYINHRYNTVDVSVGFNTTIAENMLLTAVYTANIGEYLKTHNLSMSLDYSF